MHLLSTSSASLDDIVEPVDLGQPPGDIAILSFADSDLAGLAAAWAIERGSLPSVRLVQLRDLYKLRFLGGSKPRRQYQQMTAEQVEAIRK